MKTKKCGICGKEFAGNKNQRYCSPACKVEALHRNEGRFRQTDYYKRYRLAFAKVRKAGYDLWKKEHPDWYQKEMARLMK